MTSRVLLHAESSDDPAVVSWVTSLVATASLRPDDSPLLGELVAEGVVTEVCISPGRIDVTAAAGQSWRVLGRTVRVALGDQLQRAIDRHARDDVTLQAVADVVLTQQVGALARSHGGLLTVDEVADGVVTLGRSGACGHCPAAMSTVNDRFETALRREVPWLKHVRSQGRAPASRWRDLGSPAVPDAPPEGSVFVAP